MHQMLLEELFSKWLQSRLSIQVNRWKTPIEISNRRSPPIALSITWAARSY
jgi:hypothetical protein